MELIEIDIIGLQSIQALVDRIHDMPARRAAVVRAGAHRSMNLGGDHHVLTLDAEILESLAEQLFRLTRRIDVGGINEIYAGGECPLDDPVNPLDRKRTRLN